MNDYVHASRKTARLAGLYYFLHIAISIYGIIFVSARVHLTGGPDEIIQNILHHEFIFRTGIVTRLLSSVPWVFLALALFRLMKPVNSFQARLMFTWMVISIPIGFIAEAFDLSGLLMAKGDMLKSADMVLRQHDAALMIGLYNPIISISEIFWGLWLLPFGLLIYHSGFIPRLLGILLFLSGSGYIGDTVTFLLFPAYRPSVSSFILLFGSISEISIMLWLIIKGTRSISGIRDGTPTK